MKPRMGSSMFDHSIQIEGYYWCHDTVEELLFNEYGYPQGNCAMCDRGWYAGDGGDDGETYFDKYPRCADINHESYNKFRDWLIPWCKEKGITDPETYDSEGGRYGADGQTLEHSHVGTWKQTGGKKIGYDYMVYTYSFKSKNELACFLLKHGGKFKIYRREAKML